MAQTLSPPPPHDRLLMPAGVLFLSFGLALVLAPFPVFTILVRFLPWLLGASALLAAAAALRDLPLKPLKVLLAGVALAAGIWLGFMAQYRDRALWYLAAGLVAWSAWRVLRSAPRSGAAAGRTLAALPALFFAALMLFRPRSGLSAALTLFGIFVLAWGVVLLTLPAGGRRRM